MSDFPSVWEVALLVGATYRIWRLLAYDTITDRLRGWAFPKGSKREEHGLVFVQCPWCAGFWMSVVAWGLWQAWPHATIVVCVPLTISTLVGLIPRNLDP